MNDYVGLKVAGQITPQVRTVEFWDGHKAEIDLSDIMRSAVSVKGSAYHNPLRFLEIYGNLANPSNSTSICTNSQTITTQSRILDTHKESNNIPKFTSCDSIRKKLMPSISGVNFELGESIRQPPFSWNECDPRTLGINFTYNTNAIYRILNNLHNQGRIPRAKLDTLLDRACVVLSNIYKCEDHFLIRNINNNINMFLISKVIELLVGRSIYDAEQQEYHLTRKSLQISLELVKEHNKLSTIEMMAVALGKGVSFIENRLAQNGDSKEGQDEIRAASFQYYERELAIDHRHILLDMISNACLDNGRFLLVVILDDATETVDDLLWLQDLLVIFPYFKAHVLVNTAQVSVNFCSSMLSSILMASEFSDLAARFGKQFVATEIYCPFISYQTNYLPLKANQIIDEADAVFVKGANFFETCQIPHKPVFHAFVVYGPISRKYTGLDDYDAVFAYVQSGETGYLHNKNVNNIVTLASVSQRMSRSRLLY